MAAKPSFITPHEIMFHPIAQTVELEEGFRKEVQVEGEYILLIHHQGTTYLIESHCPHAAYSMVNGTIIGSDLRCPVHGYLFDIPSGRCTLSLEGPCRDLKIYKPTVLGDQVGIHLPLTPEQ